ncbi:class I SAM-dependent DNA methyltransferase [Aliiruegeria sabulilitoris]|uniref:class I SAM-dependent DNA methyltransferase n=1 Tax=Aliiruegeria sabulilitoris TaxID=1510458 RepID=UPI00082C01E2|nr:class I SAM-dependent methyltransferase [Aliiruegeria sabulilitoris]NDR56855.1 class I SAM-dependent methyltransferase [Pseudoruegeria sp. M32A2M]
MSDERTLSVYDTQAGDYAQLVETGRPYPRLEAFMDRLPKGGRVLDLGCGPGNWAARMIERGLEVVALDASDGMAAVAAERYGLTVRVARFDSVTETEAYDGIWAHFSLLHAPRSAMPGHLAALYRALRPGGWFLLALKLGSGEARDGKDRFYTYYTEDELCGLLDAAGFEIVIQEHGEDVGFDGTPHEFIVLTARKP